MRPRGQTGEQLAQCRRRRPVGLAHQGQRRRLDVRTQRVVRAPGRGAGVDLDFLPLPVVQPEVGRMDAVRAGQLLHRQVLREQRQRRHGLVGQQAPQVVQQRKRGPLDGLDGCDVERHGPAAEPLQRGLVGAQQLRRRGQTHQLQRPDALVQLCPRRAQYAGIDGVDVGTRHRLGLLEVAPHRLVRRLQRAAQFVLHPGQRAQVVNRLGVVRRIHGWPRSGVWVWVRRS